MSKRTEILDRLFINAKTFMAELSQTDGLFTNLQVLLKLARDQQKAYIELLYSFKDTKKSP